MVTLTKKGRCSDANEAMRDLVRAREDGRVSQIFSCVHETIIASISHSRVTVALLGLPNTMRLTQGGRAHYTLLGPILKPSRSGTTDGEAAIIPGDPDARR